MEEILQQYELPKGARVKLSDGSTITFLKMDGMYALWDQGGKIVIGNFRGFRKVEDHYEVVPESLEGL